MDKAGADYDPHTEQCK